MPLNTPPEVMNSAPANAVHMAYLRESVDKLDETLRSERLPITQYVKEATCGLQEQIRVALADSRRQSESVEKSSNERHAQAVKLLDDLRISFAAQMQVRIADSRRDIDAVINLGVERHDTIMKVVTSFQGNIDLLKSGFQDRFQVIIEDGRREAVQITQASLERHATSMELIRDLKIELIKEIAAVLSVSGERQTNSLRAVEQLRDGFKEQLTVIKEDLNNRFKAIEKGTDVSRDSISKEFEGVNEFREQLKDHQNTLITRTEVGSMTVALSDRLNALEKVIANYEGRMLMIGLLSAAIPTLVIILLHFMR